MTGEFLELFSVTLPELLDIVRRGEITDVKTDHRHVLARENPGRRLDA